MSYILYVILALSILSVGQICIAIWGLSLIDNNCQTLSLYSRLRTLLVTNVVTTTMLFSKFICDTTCYGEEDNDEIPIWVGIVLVISSIINYSTSSNIYSDISDCTTFSPDNFKAVLLYGGIFPNACPLLFGLYVIGKPIWDLRKSSERRKAEKEAKNRAKQLEKASREEEKSLEEERRKEEAESKAEEAKSKLEKIKKQREEKEKEAKSKEEEKERKARGDLTASERVELAKKKKKDKKVADARSKISDIETQIQSSSEDSDKVVELGKELENAKKELKNAESNIDSSSVKRSFWNMSDDD